MHCGYSRVPRVRVAYWLADSQSKKTLVTGVGQGVDGFREHACWAGVDPRQEFEEEIQAISEQEMREIHFLLYIMFNSS